MKLIRLSATITFTGLALLGVALKWPAQGRSASPAHRVNFSRDIQPILNQNCVSCHGGVRQSGGVSFIYREEALGKGKSGRPIVVPGHPESSQMIARLTSADAEERMPYHGVPLHPEQIALMKQWIKEGAQWEDYWAFVPPKPQTIPAVKQSGWARQPLDRFIQARLEQEGLKPSPEADKAELLRRVSFDLIGMPPTRQELDAFLADTSPNAYEKQVDRLLASPHYGERWATLWMELARFADTTVPGQGSAQGGVWPYRDWVIDAYNRNLPYDKFVVTQLAGDLLPNATMQDRIATSFHQQTITSGRGSELERMESLMDRVATTWSVLNGVTFNCVQCHSHPYDPIRHVEYYKFLAFFNNSRDSDTFFDPALRVPTDKARAGEAQRIQDEIASLRKSVADTGRQIEASAGAWTPLPITAGAADEVLAHERMLELLKAGDISRYAYSDPVPKDKKKALKAAISVVEAQVKNSKAKRAAKLASGKDLGPDFTFQDGEARVTANTQGQWENVFTFTTAQANIPVMTALRFEVSPKDPVTARQASEDGFFVSQIDAWVVGPDGHKKKINFRYLVPDSEKNLEFDLSRVLNRPQMPGDKTPRDAMDRLANASEFTSTPTIYRTRWVVAIPDAPVALAAGSRIETQLTHYYNFIEYPFPLQRLRLIASSDPKWTELVHNTELIGQLARLEDLTRQLDKMPAVAVPVMLEQCAYEPRETKEFHRGSRLAPVGPALAPDVPAMFPKLPANEPRNRLGLARWFFAPGQPLTARVAVNRYWEQMFGIGIVETLENFGSVGERPSHPELLDWLALHFQNDLHWDTKALLREIATSATYRQSAKATPELKRRDQRNRLLAHGPQQRLAAEMVFDQALVASGLLDPSAGGPPVMPPAPPDDEDKAKGKKSPEKPKKAEPSLLRRAVYTQIERGNMYPGFATFDASMHTVSLPRRIPTNTPLQALIAMNDPVFVQAAAALAARMMIEVPGSAANHGAGAGANADALTDARIRYGFSLVLSRQPSEDAVATFRGLYQNALAESQMSSPGSTGLKTTAPADRVKTALTSVARAMFNLDAALTR